ncbi:MAG: hypothetical protein JJV98_05495 [Desulfosarcina sp.]|nr:hypothetical protein [Desulfobacterales bacterium]
MKHSIHILMDDREQSGTVFKALAAMDDVSVQIRRLALGDYQIDGRILVERKCGSAFIRGRHWE